MTLPLLLLLPSLASAGVEFEGKSFYLGDLHAHTGVSADGGSSDMGDCLGECGAFAEVFELARANGLDFLSLTEHVNGGATTDAPGFAMEMEALQAAGEVADGLVLLPGAELWWRIGVGNLGHKNLYFRASNEELAGLTLEDVRPNGDSETIEDCADIWDFVEQVESRWGPVMLLAHHTAVGGGMGTDWSCHLDPRAARLSPAMEIYSRHGNSEECKPDFDPVWQTCEPTKTALAAIDPGGNALHLGFIGGTDEHDTHPGAVCQHETQLPQHPYGGGLTVAVLDVAAPFDRGALFDAIAARSTYATSGPLLPVVVSYGVGGRPVGGLGQDLAVPEGEDLEVEVHVPEEHTAAVLDVRLITPKERIALTHEGQGSYLGRVDGEERPVWAYIRIQLDGETWYGAEDCDDGGTDHMEYLWLSPSWLVLPEPDTGQVDDTGVHDTDTKPHDSGDSIAQGDTEAPCGSDCDCDCQCECTCDERGCGLLGVSGLFALALSALPLLAGRSTSRA